MDGYEMDELDKECHIIGSSPALRSVYHLIERVAPSDSTVMIYGESGTGKELVARVLHQKSPRAGRPFVAINCAALAESLLQSELFGHEKGAYTGAVGQRIGKLEMANGGTVFLDEISEIAPSLQAKLLRTIQEREIERVGGNQRIPVNIRIIAATNRNLEEAMKAGLFRQDLFFRLNVVSITLPPLRDRREDILILANYFIAKYSQKTNRQVTGLSEEAQACLTAYDWPGNVRELENAIERAVVLGTTSLLLKEDLPDSILESSGFSGIQPRFHEVLQNTKRRLLQDALDQSGGDYREAARLLGVHPSYAYRLMRALGIRWPR